MSRNEGLVDYSDSGSENLGSPDCPYSASPSLPERKRGRVFSWDAAEDAANEEDVQRSSSSSSSSSSSNVRNGATSRKKVANRVQTSHPSDGNPFVINAHPESSADAFK
jgi:hypothetical protein